MGMANTFLDSQNLNSNPPRKGLNFWNMTVSEKINNFIETEGKGDIRDALNIALIEKAGLIEMLDTSEPIGSIADKIISGISAPHDQHTPTPWTASENDWYIVAKSGHICEMIGPHGYETQRANARRIVAAVNATAGITTEELEFAIEENIRLDFTGRAKRINKMEAEVPAINARLLEALKRLVHHHTEEENSSPQYLDFALFTARAAIAEAETSSAHPSTNVQHNQVIANLSEKLGSAIKALRDIAETLMEITGGSGPVQGSVSDALETAKEALKPYHPDDPDPCDLARDYNDALRDADQPTPYDP